ncbi:glutaredoxin family protein [Demequina sp.]|uniref:glutaredoxin family protein n=1 Tax=Demequina sp. TaxID=2050685 RepID=UPI0025C4A99A|nr:glutaredoxin family protein [Demequina sp.]
MNERVVLYTRKGCHLCDNARQLVLEVCAENGVAWREVDIDTDPAVRARLSDLTPVVEVDGVQVGYWRIRPELVRLALDTNPGVVGG